MVIFYNEILKLSLLLTAVPLTESPARHENYFGAKSAFKNKENKADDIFYLRTTAQAVRILDFRLCQNNKAL